MKAIKTFYWKLNRLGTTGPMVMSPLKWFKFPTLLIYAQGGAVCLKFNVYNIYLENIYKRNKAEGF